MCCLVTGGKGNCLGCSGGAATSDASKLACSALMVGMVLFETNSQSNQGLWVFVAKGHSLYAAMSLHYSFPKISRGKSGGQRRTGQPPPSSTPHLSFWNRCIVSSITSPYQHTTLATAASLCLRTSVYLLRVAVAPRATCKRTAHCSSHAKRLHRTRKTGKRQSTVHGSRILRFWSTSESGRLKSRL